MKTELEDCLKACNDCATNCEHCATACLREDDVAMMARCIELDRFCADACRLAAAFIARTGNGTDPKVVQGACLYCAEVCDLCARECAKHQHAHCQACAEACRRCAAECRTMAA